MKTPEFWQKMTKKQRKEAINTIILVVVVIGGTFGAMAVVKLALHTDYPLVVVTSESMLPDIEVGDLLVVKGVDPSEIIPGDHENRTGSIIIYDTHGIWGDHAISEPVVHRVVGSYYNDTDNRYYFITQGDNNFDTDPPGMINGKSEIPVPEDNVLGVVIYQIPKVGKVKMFLDNSGLTWILIVILSVLLVISIVQDILHPEEDNEEKEKKGKEERKTKIDEVTKEKNILEQTKGDNKTINSSKEENTKGEQHSSDFDLGT
ncbi:MAG: signal peptidase I [Candidatus Lokiarchaeota archaeon]|nr:signal peptidase I [Candidatus Harpocratesius repetitus]